MPNLKPSEILRAGLNLLETRGWTQHDYARDKNGYMAIHLHQAVCLCSIGAIRAAAFGSLFVPKGDCPDSPYAKARQFLHNSIGVFDSEATSFPKWQDETWRTFAEVKAKFQEAIQLAEQQEQGV